MLRSNYVLGASDGIITTFAIIAGSAGASLTSKVIIILGLAKLFADAISMASGVYLGMRSEVDYQGARGDIHRHFLLKHSLLTFVSFVTTGALPLAPYVLRFDRSLELSILIVFLELFTVGCLKTLGTRRKLVMGGIEMFAVGGSAALVAYIVGFLLDRLV